MRMSPFLLVATLVCIAPSLSVGERRVLHQAQAPTPGPRSGHGNGTGTNEACCAKLTAINFKTNLPVVIVDTFGVNVTRNDTAAEICTCSYGLQKGDMDAKIQFRIRGGINSQLRNRILQYAIDIDDKKWFLGMPKSRKWMLHGQQLDPFRLHQWLGYNLTRATNPSVWAARTQFCELFLIDNGLPLSEASHYRGLYLGMERVNQEDNRVNISANNNTADVSGGYMMEFKHGQNVKNLPTVLGNVTRQQWNVEYPNEDDISPAMIEYIQGYLNNFEAALYAPTFADPMTGWRAFANETSFVDWFLASELIRNVKHTYHSNAWITKDAGKKFDMGPVWNNVQGFGTCCGYPVQGYNNSGISPVNPASGGTGISSSGWLFTVCLNDNCPILDTYAPGYGISTWFQQLWKDPTWIAACAKRFAELREGPWSDARMEAIISSVRPLLAPAAVRTLDRSSHRVSISTGPRNPWKPELRQEQYFPTPEAQFDNAVQSLQDWTLSRLRWMDGAFRQAVTPGQAEGPYPSSYAATPSAGVVPPNPGTTGK